MCRTGCRIFSKTVIEPLSPHADRMLYSSFSYKRRASTSPWPTHEAWALLPRRPFAGAARDDCGQLACGSSAVNFFLGRPLRLVPLARHSWDAMQFGLLPAEPRVGSLLLPAQLPAPKTYARPLPAHRSPHADPPHRLRPQVCPTRRDFLLWLQGGVDDMRRGPPPWLQAERSAGGAAGEARGANEAWVDPLRVREAGGAYDFGREIARARSGGVDRGEHALKRTARPLVSLYMREIERDFEIAER